ncbi:PREDICTED: uncharacterized protein LOC101304089 [Fragaria vesca subsp. vesca]
MRGEVQKLKFIREVRYPQWLANVVMVPKKSTGQWRMCVDYSNLNRACPKDSFPLPRIDQLVDSTSGFELLSFMDAYAGYNQIRMDPRDEEHTAFTTDKAFIAIRRGIEANPEKIQAILDMERPKERNEVSSLAGKIVAFARFVSRLTDKCAPFFRLLKDQRCKKPEISGRLVKWAIELGEFDIHYRPRVAIKGQTAADFISELTPMKVVGVSNEANREENGPGAAKEMHSEEPPAQLWRLFVEGSVTRNKSGAGIILETPDGFKHEYALEFQFKASNNAAEYEALIGGLQLARGIGVERVEIFSDSQLVVNQVNGSFEAKEPQLHSYQALSKAFMQRFKSVSLSLTSPGNKTVMQMPSPG